MPVSARFQAFTDEERTIMANSLQADHDLLVDTGESPDVVKVLEVLLAELGTDG